MMVKSLAIAVLCGLLATTLSAPTCAHTENDLLLMLKNKPGDKPTIDEALRGFYCLHGGKPVGPDDENNVGQSAAVTVNGKCMMAENYDEDAAIYDCCEQEGFCRGASCAILGGNTENGTSCDCLSCPCIECGWYKSACFTADGWHEDDDGNLNERGGHTCFGRVRCQKVLVNGQWIRPDECGDYRVGSYCIEDNVHFENKLDVNKDGFDDGWYGSTMQTKSTKVVGQWNRTFKTCGWHLCDSNADCCKGQKCDPNQAPISGLCPKCGVHNGTCTDDVPFVPTGECPCDPKYRSEECQAVSSEHVGYTSVDIPNCQYEAVEAIRAEYGCEKVSADCDTWVCTVAPTPEQLLKIKEQLSSCTPIIIQPVIKPPAPMP